MANKLKAVVLAAGKSTRMNSEKSKVLHEILGKEIINYLLDSLIACDIAETDIIVVAGSNRDEIAAKITHKVTYALQREPLGTAHALLAAHEHLAGHDGELLVVVGDNPYVSAAALQKLIVSHRQNQAQCTFISAVFPDGPPPYGRIIRDSQGEVRGVVEEKDATPEQRQICEVNASIYLFDNRVVFPLLARIDNRNAKKEFYLTDIIAILQCENFKVRAVQADDCDIAIGINDRRDLQAAQDSNCPMRPTITGSSPAAAPTDPRGIDWTMPASRPAESARTGSSPCSPVCRATSARRPKSISMRALHSAAA